MPIKVEYRAVGAVGTYTTLADFTATVREFKPAISQHVQSEELPAAANQQTSRFRQIIGNQTVSFPLDITQSYASETAASAAARTNVTNLMAGKVNLKVTKGTDVEYYPNAACKGITPDFRGATIQYVLNFETDLVTASEPS
jgi:hypothetical protein